METKKIKQKCQNQYMQMQTIQARNSVTIICGDIFMDL